MFCSEPSLESVTTLARRLSRGDKQRLRDLLDNWMSSDTPPPGEDTVTITDPVDLDGALARPPPSSADEDETD